MPDRSAAELLSAAEKGDASACYWIGAHNQYGRNGFSKDDERSRQWFMRAADLSAKYEGEVAKWLLEGRAPFSQDTVLGVARLKSAASQSDPSSCYELGYAYANGVYGLAKNLDEGRRWLYRGAELSPECAGQVAICLICGDHPFERNEAVGVAMLKKAADQGDEYARIEYAVRYDEPSRRRETLIELASMKPIGRGFLAIFALLGDEEGAKYYKWARDKCKEPVKRRAALEKATDPRSKQKLFFKRPPWSA